MKEFNYTITDPQGIHARPAGVLVKEAAKYQSTITLEKDGKTGDAKRIFAVMGLAAKCGNTLNVKVEGPDEDELQRLWKNFLRQIYNIKNGVAKCNTIFLSICEIFLIMSKQVLCRHITQEL